MDPSLYMNRELSWLEFNHRVLEEAQDPAVPLLERLKFLAIVSSNLDEFFMVRVAGVKRKARAGDVSAEPDGATAAETLAAISKRAHELSAEQHQCFMNELQPSLAQEGVVLVRPKDATAEQRVYLEQYMRKTLLPVLTPLAVDRGHPFPHLANRSLCLIASIRVATPSTLARYAARGGAPAEPGGAALRGAAVLAGDVPVHAARGRGAAVPAVALSRLRDPLRHAIRVTRDAELREQGTRSSADLMTAIEAGVRERRMGLAVRLQYDAELPTAVLATLVDELELTADDLYPGRGFTAFADLLQLYSQVDIARLKERPAPPHPVAEFAAATDVWSAIRAGDILVHHPYQSFDAVTRFVDEAALDPKVLAIKMTLYRVSPTSPIAQALHRRRARQRGRRAGRVAGALRRRGQHPLGARARGGRRARGLRPGRYKTHCKACLVVRQEGDVIRRYCHLATGNYNDRTARRVRRLRAVHLPRDVRRRPDRAVQSAHRLHAAGPLHHLMIAPIGLRDELRKKMRREAEHARGGAGAITLKMNSLVDPALIAELYDASQAGVDIALIVRGICCLRPRVPGVSDRIRVISIIDRYLEHARVFVFENGGDREYWLASADWMPRNLDSRVETAFPVLEPKLQAIVQDALDLQLRDTVKAREILPDGTSERVQRGENALRSQERLYALAAGSAPARRGRRRRIQRRRASLRSPPRPPRGVGSPLQADAVAELDGLVGHDALVPVGAGEGDGAGQGAGGDVPLVADGAGDFERDAPDLRLGAGVVHRHPIAAAARPARVRVHGDLQVRVGRRRRARAGHPAARLGHEGILFLDRARRRVAWCADARAEVRDARGLQQQLADAAALLDEVCRSSSSAQASCGGLGQAVGEAHPLRSRSSAATSSLCAELLGQLGRAGELAVGRRALR